MAAADLIRQTSFGGFGYNVCTGTFEVGALV
jgi:hypothetical protein